MSIFMVKIKKIVSLLLALLFMSYYASTTLFTHVHTINGVTIVHSHFHTGSHNDTKSGNHTKQSITLIAKISHLQFTDFTHIFVLKPLQFPLRKDKFVETTHWIPSIHFENLALRAPPVLA